MEQLLGIHLLLGFFILLHYSETLAATGESPGVLVPSKGVNGEESGGLDSVCLNFCNPNRCATNKKGTSKTSKQQKLKEVDFCGGLCGLTCDGEPPIHLKIDGEPSINQKIDGDPSIHQKIFNTQVGICASNQRMDRNGVCRDKPGVH